ncbi:MAG: SCO family protein [Chloracidobacterium sp. CP2_5A]|nr:MAG: SCO family protein [Chloracidobacterium sp. CP2_5A]
MKSILKAALLVAVSCWLSVPAALAQYGAGQQVEMPSQSSMPSASPELLKQIGVTQRLGAQLPLDVQLRDETGVERPLQTYFTDKPVIVAPVYFTCPMLCMQIINGIIKGLREVHYMPGQDFEVVIVSIDPRETAELAAGQKGSYLKRYGRPGTERGWHFLTGREEEVSRLAAALGFRYAWDEATQQYAHASAIMVATPQGQLSHYFYGVEYRPNDLRFALVQSSQGKIGSPVEQALLYCFHYDPVTGRYTPIILTAIKIFAVLTVIALGGLIGYFLWQERKERQAPAAASSPAKAG